MITEKGTFVEDTSFATHRQRTDDVSVCIRHVRNYARDLRKVFPFARTAILTKDEIIFCKQVGVP